MGRYSDAIPEPDNTTEPDGYSESIPEPPSPAFVEQQPLLAAANKKNGAPWGIRGASSYKSTPADKLGYLQYALGSDNVQPIVDEKGSETGNYLWRKPGEQQWSVFDPKFSDAPLRDLPGDLADWSGDVAMAIPAAAGFAFGPAGIPAGGAVGDVYRQAVSAVLPGDQPKSASDRLDSAYGAAVANTAGAAAGALAAPVVSSAASKVGGAARYVADVGRNLWKGAKQVPSDPAQGLATMAKAVPAAIGDTLERKALQHIAHDTTFGGIDAAGKPIADRAADNAIRVNGLESRINTRLPEDSPRIKFNLAQKTGSRTALTMDQVARQTPGRSSEMMQYFDQEQQQAMQNFYGNVIEKVTGGASDAPTAATKAAQAFNGLLENTIKARTDAARPLFQQLELASRNSKVMPLDNTLTRIDELASRATGIGPDSNRATIKYLAGIRDQFLEAAQSKQVASKLLDSAGKPLVSEVAGEPAMLTPLEFQKSLENAGRAAKFGDSAAENLDRSATQKLWGYIYGGLQKDLDAAGAEGGQAAEFSDLLSKARTAWREGSEAIEAARPMLAEKAFALTEKDSVEQLPSYVLAKGTSNEIVRKGFAVLDKADPTIGNQLRGAVLQEIAHMSETTAPGASERDVFVSMPKLATNLRKQWPKIEAMFPNNPEHLAAIKDVIAGARLIADRANPGTSHTFTLAEHGGMVEHGVEKGLEAVAEKVPGGEAAVAGMGWIKRQFLDPERLAAILNDPEQAKLFAQLAAHHDSMRPAQITRVVAQLEAISIRDSKMFGDQ